MKNLTAAEIAALRTAYDLTDRTQYFEGVPELDDCLEAARRGTLYDVGNSFIFADTAILAMAAAAKLEDCGLLTPMSDRTFERITLV